MNDAVFVFLIMVMGLSTGFSAVTVTYTSGPSLNETINATSVTFEASVSGTTDVDTLYIDFNRDLLVASFFHDTLDNQLVYDNSTYAQHGTTVGGNVSYATSGLSDSSMKIETVPIIFNRSYDIQYDWTVSFWLRMTDSVDGYLIDNTELSGGDTRGWRVFVDFISGASYQVKLEYWDIYNTKHTASIPLTKSQWNFYTFKMSGGTTMSAYKDSTLISTNTENVFATTSQPIMLGALLSTPTGVLPSHIDDFTVFKRALTLDQIRALNGNLQTTVTLQEDNLLQNTTYEVWASAKDYAVNLWDTEYTYFNTIGGVGPPPDNDNPIIEALGTETGWTTCDSGTPRINFIVHDDSPPPFDCILYIDEQNEGTTTINETVGYIEFVAGNLFIGTHFARVECEDIYGGIGTSVSQELAIENCHFDVDFRVCAYDNETLEPLVSQVISNDGTGRGLVFAKFTECFETVLPVVYGNSMTVSINSIAYLPYFEVVSPITDVNATAFLLKAEGVSGQVSVINLTGLCLDINLNEPIEVGVTSPECIIGVLRCDSPLFPYSCDFMGFTDLKNTGEFVIKITEAGYFGDYIMLQSSCNVPLTCYKVIEPILEVPGVVVNLTKNPEMGALIIMLLILGGFVLWTVDM